MVSIPFVKARLYTPSGKRNVKWVVVHSMEFPELPTAAERVAAYFAGASARGSAHYCVDDNSIVQCVAENDIAWHAAGGNLNSIGVEHAGYADQSLFQWTDPYSLAMLRNVSAPLVRDICSRYNIPIRYVGGAQLKRGMAGITTHNDVRLAFGKTTHTDPGQNFPMTQYIGWVKGGVPTPPITPQGEALAAIAQAVTNIKSHTVHIGSRGFEVMLVQKLLNQWGHNVRVDGDFGPATLAAVLAFQKAHYLKADGVVGGKTIDKLMRR